MTENTKTLLRLLSGTARQIRRCASYALKLALAPRPDLIATRLRPISGGRLRSLASSLPAGLPSMWVGAARTME